MDFKAMWGGAGRRKVVRGGWDVGRVEVDFLKINVGRVAVYVILCWFKLIFNFLNVIRRENCI